MNSAALKVEKLEALLARVQHNRGVPRMAGPGAPVPAPAFRREPQEESFEDPPSLVPEPSFTPEPARAPAAPPAPPPTAAAPVPRPPVRPVTEPIGMPSATASRPARTPLELAVENKLERPSTHPNLQPPPQMSAAVPPPVAFARQASSDEPVVLADPAPPTASRSIGQVVSKAAPIAAQTFGDLLRRSLSLRPR